MSGCCWFALFFLIVGLVRAAWDKLIFLLAQGKSSGSSSSSTFSADERQKAHKLLFLTHLMPLLAMMAKGDGHVTEDEIEDIESIFRTLRLTPEEREYATQLFKQNKDNLSANFETYARRFALYLKGVEIRRLALLYLIRVSIADGSLNPTERDMLYKATQAFGFDRDMLYVLYFELTGQAFPRGQRTYSYSYTQDHSDQYRQWTPPRNESSRTVDLAMLGLTEGASASDIKKAYRKKAMELHPDRLRAQGLPESMIQEATERFAKINAAYDRLTKR